MKRACHQLLTRAIFTENQYVGIGKSHFFNIGKDLLHFRADPDHVMIALIDIGSELALLGAQFVDFQL